MILILLLLLQMVRTLNRTGEKFNSFYPIAHYYGSRDKGKPGFEFDRVFDE